MCKPVRPSIFGNLIGAVLFVGLSSTIWLVVNDFEVARTQGVDPLRYEYFVSSDLSEYFADSSLYTIVLLLRFIYQYLTFYTGFIVFIGLCFFVVLNGSYRCKLALRKTFTNRTILYCSNGEGRASDCGSHLCRNSCYAEALNMACLFGNRDFCSIACLSGFGFIFVVDFFSHTLRKWEDDCILNFVFGRFSS